MDECRQNPNQSSISPSASSSSESATGQAQDADDEEEQDVEDQNANDKTLLSSTSSPQLDSHNHHHNSYNCSRLMMIPYQPDLRIIRHVMNMSPSCLLNYMFSLENRLSTLRHERKVLESENTKLRTFFRLQYNLRSNSNSSPNSNPMEKGKANSSPPTNDNNCTGRETTNPSTSVEKRENEKISQKNSIEVQTEIPYPLQIENRRTHEIETMTDTEDLSQNNITSTSTANRNVDSDSEDRKESFVSVLAPPLKIKESKKSLGRNHGHRLHSHRSSSSIIPNIRASAIVPTHAEPLQEAANLIRTIRSPTFFPEDTSAAVLSNNTDNDDDADGHDLNNQENNNVGEEEPQALNVHSISFSSTNLRSASTPQIHSTLSSKNLSVNAHPEIATGTAETIGINSPSNSVISTTSTLLAPPTNTITTTATATLIPVTSDIKPESSNSSTSTSTGNRKSENPNPIPISRSEPKQKQIIQKRREFQERIEHLIRKSSAILCQNQNQNQNPNHNIPNEQDVDENTSAAASSSILGPLSISGVSSRTGTGAQSSSSWSDYTDFSSRRRTRQSHRYHHFDSSSSSSQQIALNGIENFPTLNSLSLERPHSLSSIRTQLQFNVQLLQVHRRQQAAGNLIEEQEDENDNDNESEDHDEDLDLDPEQEILRPLLGQRNVSNGGQSNRSQIQSNDSLHVNVDSVSSSGSSTEEGRDRGDAGASSPSSSDSESQSETDVSSVHSLFHPSETQSTTLCGKYGNLTAYTRPRPASGHRYVISELLTRKNESKLPSWVPNYAQKIECILTRYLDEAQANSNTVKTGENNDESQASSIGGSKSSGKPTTTTSSAQKQAEEDEQKSDKIESATGIPLDLVFVRLNSSPPPITLLEFDKSSEESCCIKSISSTKRRKSCLRISRDVKSFGESRPKNLSFSQHVYIADDDTKTRSCPGIYYMGEFSIQTGVTHLHAAELKRIGILKRRKYKRMRKMVRKVFHCFRCSSNSNLLQASHIFISSNGKKKKTLSAAQSTTHIPILVDALSSHCQCPQSSSNYNVSVSKKASSMLKPHRKKSNQSYIKNQSSNINQSNEHDGKS